MKIGILTFHRPCNFGANLQAFASSNYFQSLGHDVYIINYLRDSDKNYVKTIPSVQYKAHSDFVNLRLRLTEEARTEEQLCKIVEDYSFDLIVIGADAVWRQSKDCKIFFAEWLFSHESIAHTPVVSMSAAHMGSGFGNLDKQQRHVYGSCLMKFKYISVRDSWTRSVILHDLLNSNSFPVHITPDPVIVLDRFITDKWQSNGVSPKKYYLMTLPCDWGKSKRSGAIRKLWFRHFKNIVNKAGYQLVELPLPEGTSGMPFDVTVFYPTDPVQWYLWIKNAKAFIGLRFHAIMSAITAGVPFFSIDSYGAPPSNKLLLQEVITPKKSVYPHDTESKIYHLLKGTAFESFRIPAYLESQRPSVLFKKVEGVKIADIEALRNQMQQQFMSAMKKMLTVVQGRQRSILKLGDKCTGCFACYNACSAHAISMDEDDEGFYMPNINTDLCVDCGRCDKSCPQISQGDYHSTQKAYYGYATDEELRKSSSSGGLFSIFAQDVIGKGGKVYGAAFNFEDNIRLECQSAAKIMELRPLLKSKYVQSYIGEAFISIKKELAEGKQILFCGTPCQVDGLRRYLGRDVPNLITIDFVCHGVPPMSMLRKHLEMLGISHANQIDFRPKKRSWVDDIVIKYDGDKTYVEGWKYDAFYNCFMNYGNLRRSCYNCHYCNGQRAADITIADFWGYRQYDETIYDPKGLSLILTNTQRGQTFVESATLASTICAMREIAPKYAEYVYMRKRQGKNGYDIEKRNQLFGDIETSDYREAVKKNGFLIRKSFKEKVKERLRNSIGVIFLPKPFLSYIQQ